MANEITVSASLQCNNGGAAIASGSISKAITQVGTHMGTSVQDIATTAAGEALTLPPDIGTLGQLLIKNLSSDYYVELSWATTDEATFNGSRFAKIEAGAPIVLGIPTGRTAIYARANTGAASIQYWLTEA